MLLQHLLDHAGTAVWENNLLQGALWWPDIQKRKPSLFVDGDINFELGFPGGRLHMHVSAVKNLLKVIGKQVVLLLALFFNDRLRRTTKRRRVSESTGFEKLP
ncbi:hypothetical protein D3C76_1031330 [compost metagenome]